MSAAPSLLSSSRACHPSSRPSLSSCGNGVPLPHGGRPLRGRRAAAGGLLGPPGVCAAGRPARRARRRTAGRARGRAAGRILSRSPHVRSGRPGEAVADRQDTGRRAVPVPRTGAAPAAPNPGRLLQCHLCRHACGAKCHANLHLPDPADGAAALGRAGPHKDGTPAAAECSAAWPACRWPAPAVPARPRCAAATDALALTTRRAQAKGLAAAQNQFLKGASEEADADELRAAVSDALCRSQQRLAQFKEVVPSIEAVEGGMTKCARARRRAAARDRATECRTKRTRVHDGGPDLTVCAGRAQLLPAAAAVVVLGRRGGDPGAEPHAQGAGLRVQDGRGGGQVRAAPPCLDRPPACVGRPGARAVRVSGRPAAQVRLGLCADRQVRQGVGRGAGQPRPAAPGQPALHRRQPLRPPAPGLGAARAAGLRQLCFF